MVPTRMFKSRSGSQGNPSTPPPQSIDAVRRRARHRLIGAAVLVALGVVGFAATAPEKVLEAEFARSGYRFNALLRAMAITP